MAKSNVSPSVGTYEQELEKQSQSLTIRANSFAITTDTDYQEAMQFVVEKLKPLRKAIEETFDPIIDQAHKTWKSAIAKKNEKLEPINNAIAFLDKKGKDFRYIQEQKRQEEQRKADELARKEQAKLEERARKAEEKGKTEKAEELQQKAQEVIAPVVAPKVSKVDGIVIKKLWTFEIIDAPLIPREYLMPDLTKIGAVVRATKNTLNIPGIRQFQKESSL